MTKLILATLSLMLLGSTASTPRAYILTDAEAGYNQAAYDACMDSYDESCGDDVECVDCSN